MAEATTKQIATLLDMTPRNVTKLVKEKGFPRLDAGRFDVVASVQWYVKH